MSGRCTIVALVLCLSACKPPPAEEPSSKPEPVQPEPAAQADPVLQESFTFEVGVAWNRHHDFGADGERLDGTVTLVLYEGGKARVEDRGERKLSTLDNTYGYEEEIHQWSNVWTGSWAKQEQVLLVDLQLAVHGCEKSIEGLKGEGVKEKLTCEPVQDKVQLRCEAQAITLDPVQSDLPPGEPEQVVDAWVCHPTGDDVDLGGTPVSWVFGKDACIEASSGPYGSRSYGPCREDEPI
jgi:hypothetical protein